MKTSIAHLPAKVQNDLDLLIELIRKELGTRCHMIILYGSYARGNYVVWDQYMEGHMRLAYKSDYDIMIVTSNINPAQVESDLGRKIYKIFEKAHARDERTTFTHIIVENIRSLNANLGRSQFFFTEIVNEGIMLYNSEKFTLATPRELNFSEIKDISEKYFKEIYPLACQFLKTGRFSYQETDYILGSFLIHQACERFYKTISLVFTHFRPKEHDLRQLLSYVKEYSVDLNTLFPLTPDFEKRCYELLCDAYIDSRYNDKFVITKAELEYMIKQTDVLKEVTERICTEKLAWYGEMVEKEN